MEPSVGVLEYPILAVSDHSQVYAGHGKFIDKLMLDSNFSTFGMPIDNADTNVAVSSWCSYNSYLLLADLVIGWSLFLAAITNDQDYQGLRPELIFKVSNRSTIPTFPATVFSVYYDSASGTSLQGVAR